MVSPLESGMEFLKEMGFFKVVLPFILIFTLMYAVLEKTKILGVADKDKREGKKNINAMVSFVIALFFVATPQLVEAVNLSLPLVAMVLIVLVSLMLLVGSVYAEGEFSFERHPAIKGWLILAIFISIIGIFIYALGYWDEFAHWWTSAKTPAMIAVIFLIAMAGAIWFITGGLGGKKENEKKNNNG